MTQDIHYKGFTAVPSDHDCEDGTLAASVDMICEDGALRPILPQKKMADVGDARPLFVHRNGNIDNLILTSSDGKLQYIDRSGDTWAEPADIDVTISEPVISVNALGNTLMVFTSGPIYYILWKDDAYSFLGNNLPDLQLSFGLVGHPRLYSQCYDENSDDKERYGRFKVGEFSSIFIYDELKESDQSNVTSQVMAKLNKMIAEQATNKGRFCFPFFVRYAYRLFDGSLVCHSAPVLMTPSTGKPLVFAFSKDSPYYVESWNSSINHFYGDILLVPSDLDWAPLEKSILSKLKNWSDVITSVDIFVSKPIYPYDQSGTIERPIYNSTNRSSMEDIAPRFVGKANAIGKNDVSRKDLHNFTANFETEDDYLSGFFDSSFSVFDVFGNNGYAEWNHCDLFRLFFTRDRVLPDYFVNLPDFEDEENGMLQTIKDTAQYYLLKSYELSEVTGFYDGDAVTDSYRMPVSVKDDYLQSLVNRESMTDDYLSRDKMHASMSYGYNSRINLSGVERQPCIGFRPDCMFPLCNQYFNLDYETSSVSNPSDTSSLLTSYRFYDSLPLASISGCVDNTYLTQNTPFSLTVFGYENSTNWAVKKTQTSVFRGLFSETLSKTWAETRTLRSAATETKTEIRQYTKGSKDVALTTIVGDTTTTDTETLTTASNVTKKVTAEYTSGSTSYTATTVQEYDEPRYSMCWFFYPNTNATKIVVQCGEGRYCTVPLKKHDFLNGAYALLDFGAVREPETTKPEGLDSALTDKSKEFPISVPNKIYTSEVGNPFYFPVLNIYTVGTGNILNICAATKAMSQGQFGQFPLYAFTDEGVYALEVSSTGTFAAKQPITRDVCLSADGIASLDSAVLFPTQRGILLLSGSTAMSISDTICTEYPTDITSLPGFAALHKLLGHADGDSCFPTKPFQEYVAGCRIIYDYVHQRVWIYNPAYTYTYVYSLRSQLWGMSYQTFSSHINDYPDALAVTKDGSLLSFSSFGADEAKCLFVTRPLKLGGGSIFKSPDTVIQRGFFESGHVASALYGSRDLLHWHLVDSSKTHRLTGFNTTPYKYFRIAGVATLSGAESIVGATVQFETKLDKQIH